MADFSRYSTFINTQTNQDDFIRLSPSLRKLREEISKNGLTSDSKITATGQFSSNQINIDRYSLDTIQTVSGISIGFIVNIIEEDKNTLFTSPSFKQQLVSTYSTNNPYLVLSALSNIVDINLIPIIDKISRLREEEILQNTRVSFNNFISISDDGNTTIDYNSLLIYLNWVVSKPSQNFDERVLSVNSISEFSQIESRGGSNNNEDSSNNNGSSENGDSGNVNTNNGGSTGTTSDPTSDTNQDNDNGGLDNDTNITTINRDTNINSFEE